MKKIIFVLLLAACGDNASPVMPDAILATPDASPPQTWRDVTFIWGELYCTWAARCFPDYFPEWYGNHASCVDYSAEYNCVNIGAQCYEAYPADHLLALAQCSVDMETLTCQAQIAPESCYEAFTR